MLKIYRNLVLVFVLVTGMLFSFLTYGMITSDFQNEAEYLAEIVDQVMENTDNARKNYNAKLLLMEDAWVDRAENAEFLISNLFEMKEQSELDRLAVILGASNLYVYDNNQKICRSTDLSTIGSKLQDEKDKLKELMADKKNHYYVHIEQSGFWKDPSYCRLMIKATAEEYSAICIEADVMQMGLKSERTIIEKTLLDAATEFDTSIVEIGKDSGAVLGMTKNNDQTLNIEGGQTYETRLNYLKKAVKKTHDHVKINGQYCIAVVREYDGAYVMAFSPMSDTVLQCLEQWVKTFSVFVITIVIIIWAIYYNFKKYVLRHFDEMENKLNSILEGDFDVALQEGNNRDINKLIRVIEKLKMGYIHKSERTDKMLEVLGDDIAVFECVFGMNYYFFSDKMRNMLSMDEIEWNYYLDNKQELLQLIREIDESKDENEVVFFRGKYLEMQLCKVEKELVGVIIDQTKEITRRYKLEDELKESEKKLGVDALTGVLNRGGFESQVKKFLEESQDEGVLIAFDLDNFKTINDTLGHPEGDKVLQIFANCLKGMFRMGDIVGRIGGDEFSVFMTTPMAEKMAEHKIQVVQEKINECLGEYHDVYGVSVSAGVVFAKKGEDYKELYQKVDEALYVAKKGGKDCYAVYGKHTVHQ